MRSLDNRGDTPTFEVDDALEVKIIPNPFAFRHLADDVELVDALVHAVNAMGGAGECAEDDYQRALGQLRRKAKRATDAIATEYSQMAEDAYTDRWSLVMLLVELAHRDSVGIFAEILGSQIPEERSTDPHSFTTAGEEVMIRTTAVEGLERLAADGNEEALDVLLANVTHENFSVRRAAVQALVATGDDDMQKRLAKALPSRHRELLKIQRRDVRTVEQAQGGMFLKPTDQGGAPAPADDCHDKDPGHTHAKGDCGCDG